MARQGRIAEQLEENKHLHKMRDCILVYTLKIETNQDRTIPTESSSLVEHREV